MHDVVERYIEGIKEDHPSLFIGKKVLEFGSFDINGGVRKYFTNCDYTGLDWRPGPSVDVVSLMHKYESHAVYDVVITTSALEHDPYWKESLRKCLEILKVGGSLIITCGGPTYEEHCIETSPPTEEGKAHYAGVSVVEIEKVILADNSFELMFSKSTDRDTLLLYLGKR